MGAFDAIKQNHLTMKMVPISYRELLYLKTTPCNTYTLEETLFKIIISKGRPITKELIRNLIDEGHNRLFIHEDDLKNYLERQQEALTHVTRSISIGDPLEKATKQVNLLTVNLHNLYNNPHNDTLLSLQFQSMKNLAYLLMSTPQLTQQLIGEYQKHPHYFLYSQPMQASLHLIHFLVSLKSFNDKEIESLFLTSYFKDIGMSSIPLDFHDKKDLGPDDIKILSKHSKISHQILSGRINLPANHFHIIETHHQGHGLADLDNELIKINSGIESTLITVMDIICAMTTERPYRKSQSVFESLEMIKNIMIKKYPQEFKLLVLYFKNLLKNK